MSAAPALLIVWFATPWVIAASKLIRTMIYDSRHGYSYGGTLSIPGIFRKIEERRKSDPDYDRMRADLNRWFLITIIWWVGSFFALVAFAFAYSAFAR